MTATNLELPQNSVAVLRRELIDEWRSATTEREKARVEDSIFATSTPEERATCGRQARQAFVRRVLASGGITELEGIVRLRAGLYSAGPAADPLWARIESGEFSPRIAYKRLARARLRAKTERINLSEAVHKFLADYDRLPKRRTPNGRLIGFANPGAFTRAKLARKSQAKTPNRIFWFKMRELLHGHIMERLGPVDAAIADSLLNEFSAELATIIELLQGKIQRKREMLAAGNGITTIVRRQKLIEACNTLGMDPPRPGLRVDMTLAKSRKRVLAKAYHPDIAGDVTRSQYEAVLGAYTVVEEYDEAFTAKQA